MSHQGPENGHGMNGVAAASAKAMERCAISRSLISIRISAPQPHVQPRRRSRSRRRSPAADRDTLDEIPEFLQAPVREARKEGARRTSRPRGEAADPVRRRRKRYAANGDGAGELGRRQKVRTAKPIEVARRRSFD